MTRTALLLLLVGCSADDETARLKARIADLESRLEELERARAEAAEVEPTTTRAAQADDRATDAEEAAPLPLLEGAEPPPESETVVVTMDSSSLRFHGRPVSRDELRQLLQRRVEAGTEVSLVLRASGDVSTGRIDEIVQLARALGISHIAQAQTE